MRYFYLLLSASVAFQLCGASAVCSKSISSPKFIKHDVIVTGNCELSGVLVFGNVVVKEGGTLVTKGRVVIFGQIKALKSGSITLGCGTVVTRTVSFKESSSSLVISKGVRVGSIVAVNVDAVRISGESRSITAENSSVEFQGGAVRGGGVSMKGNGQLIVCGTRIVGGIDIRKSSGDVRIDGTTCEQSILVGSMTILESSSDIRIFGGSFIDSDLIITNHTSSSSVDVSNANMDNVKISFINGAGSILDNIVARKGISVEANTQDIIFRNSKVFGRFLTKGGARCAVFNNKFDGGPLTVIKVNFEVIIENNFNTSLAVFSNKAKVTVSDNEARDGELSLNTGGLTIERNKFDAISCSGNDPPPTLSGNTVRQFALDQCSTIMVAS